MKKYLLILAFLCTSLQAAIPAGTVWEIGPNGNQNNSGGFVWQNMVSSTFTWTPSVTSGEFYCTKGSGACTNTEPLSVSVGGLYRLSSEGTVGALTSGQWGWGDNDSLGFSTLYVRPASGQNPQEFGSDYVLMSRGVDYSQQDSAQYTYSDLACADGDAATPVVTSASHNFVAADVNNIIHITTSTGGWTAGWYHIVSTNANAATLDRACGVDGALSAGTYYVGGRFNLVGSLSSEFTQLWAAGHTVFISAGNTNPGATYSPGENISATGTGSSASPVRVIGYRANRMDACEGAYRPTISMGANNFGSGNQSQYYNLIMTITQSSGWQVGNSSLFNCKSTNASGTANYAAFTATNGAVFVNCEGVCTNGTAFKGSTMAYRAVGCYAHDSSIGYSMGSYSALTGCVADTCTTAGVYLGGSYYGGLSFCTIYNCGTGIQASNQYSMSFIGNIVSGCGTGAIWSAPIYHNLWAYNCWHNTTDVSGFIKGATDITADPLFVDAANGDFTLQAGSPCLNAGPALAAGLTGNYKWNIGIDQDDNMAAEGDFPDPNNVLITDTTNGVNGTLTLPDPNKVLTVNGPFGVGGTGSTPAATIPDGNNVLAGTGTYGVGGTGSTPALTLPTASQVLANVTYGVGGTGTTGNVVLPAENEVKAGVTFGPSSGLTGTYAAGDANLVTAMASIGLNATLVSELTSRFVTHKASNWDDTLHVPIVRLDDTWTDDHFIGVTGSGTSIALDPNGRVTVGTNADKGDYQIAAGTIGAATFDGTTAVAQTGDTYALAAGANGFANLKSDTAAIKLKTDNLPANPAAVGAAMTLTPAYDAAKTAAQPGDAMTLTAAYDRAKTALAATDIIDGTVTRADLEQCLLAFIAGKATVTTSGTDSIITFYRRDGTTAKFTITASQVNGSRAAPGTVNP